MNMTTTQSLQRTREQERAKMAWNLVSEIADKERKDYSSLVQGFPVMVLTNGLGQALAFLRAKNKGEHKHLYDHLQCWLEKNVPWTDKQGNELIEWVISESSEKYRIATTEALAFLNWLKRFAKAVEE